MNIRKNIKTFSEILNNDIKNNSLTGSNKAFTLSESLIMMAIIGIIAVITMTSLSSLKPNRDKMLLQKAYRATLSAVEEITNDAVAYPPLKESSTTAYAVNGLNALFAIRKQVRLAVALEPPTENHSDIVLPNIGTVKETTKGKSVTPTKASEVLTDRTVPARDSGKYTSANKFAYLFATKMIYQKINQNGGDLLSCSNNVCTFDTNDGINWTVTDGFNSSANSTSTILVDINGTKKPNKAYDQNNPSSVKQPDRFTFTVHANGSVTVPESDVVAQKYLQTRDVK